MIVDLTCYGGQPILTGVRRYQLYVTTEVFLEGPDRKVKVEGYFFQEHIPLLPLGEERTPVGVAFQDNLLSGHRKKMPLLRPGTMRLQELPPGIREEEVKAVELERVGRYWIVKKMGGTGVWIS